MVHKNRVLESRQAEAISRAELAKQGGPTERTIKRIEEGQGSCTPLTKFKIVKAFNSLLNKQREYTLDFLFPED